MQPPEHCGGYAVRGELARKRVLHRRAVQQLGEVREQSRTHAGEYWSSLAGVGLVQLRGLDQLDGGTAVKGALEQPGQRVGVARVTT